MMKVDFRTVPTKAKISEISSCGLRCKVDMGDIISFKCDACGSSWDLLVSGVSELPSRCPECDSTNFRVGAHRYASVGDIPPHHFVCRHCGMLNYEGGYTLPPNTCFTCNFWKEWLERDKAGPNSLIVDGHHYYIGEEKDSGGFRGFGGASFVIKFFDGRVVTTTNLWHQGDIPVYWRKLMPDNAVFLKRG